MAGFAKDANVLDVYCYSAVRRAGGGVRREVRDVHRPVSARAQCAKAAAA